MGFGDLRIGEKNYQKNTNFTDNKNLTEEEEKNNERIVFNGIKKI